MFNSLKKAGIANRLKDEILYEYVLDEMEQGIRVKGLWAKAIAHSEGLESKAESIYMQYRVQSIKDQLDALKIAYEEMSKNRLFPLIKNEFKDLDENPKINDERKKIEKIKNVNKYSPLNVYFFLLIAWVLLAFTGVEMNEPLLLLSIYIILNTILFLYISSPSKMTWSEYISFIVYFIVIVAIGIFVAGPIIYYLKN